MTILGIETATAVCGAAVTRDGRVVAEASVEQKNVHAEKLLGLIHSAMDEAGVALDELDGVAISIGPGSFTGLRIGLSVAKGLAYAASKPVVAVPTLKALAMRSFHAGNIEPSGFILAALDARRDEVYCQLYGSNKTGLVPVWDARDMTVMELMSGIGTRNVLLTGDAQSKILAYPEASQGITFVGEKLSRCDAGSVALLGQTLLEAGSTEDLATLEPRYIKDFFLKKQ